MTQVEHVFYVPRDRGYYRHHIASANTAWRDAPEAFRTIVERMCHQHGIPPDFVFCARKIRSVVDCRHAICAAAAQMFSRKQIASFTGLGYHQVSDNLTRMRGRG